MNKRLSTAIGLLFWAAVSGAACGTERGPVVGQSGSEEAPEPDEVPKVVGVSDSSFRIVSLGNGACTDERDLNAQSISPAADELRAKLGSSRAEFLILMKREVSSTEFPLPPTSRNDDAEAIWAQSPRALEIAKSQVCAVKEVGDAGGVYQSSFVLINAFVAELTAEAAIRLSQRADVASVELSQTDTPPP